MSRIADYLKNAGVFFLASCDGGQPKLRPLGLLLEEDGKILFGVGDFKDVYHQLVRNPLTEIVAMGKDGHWLRYTGRAVFEKDEKYAAAALEIAPDLKPVYNESTGHKMMMFHLEDARAVDMAMSEPAEELSEG